jgi:tetratricopeptide (TPR) repeat protein
MVGKFYMGNDYRRDHSFRNPRPDLTISIGTPNACNDCHADKSVAWSQGYIEKWYGSKKRPHYGETFSAANKRDPKAVPDLILYSENELFPLMVRATAVSLLANYEDSLSRKAIEKALTDPASLVRHSAINGFQPEDIQSFERLLTPLLNDPVRGIRTEAAIRLSVVPEEQLSEPARKARESALKEYVDVNNYTSDFPGGRYNLGVMYANSGELEKAAECYRAALKIDGLFYMAKVNLATVYSQQNKNVEAETLLKEVLKENPEITQVNYSLALLLAEMGKIDESRKFFLKAVELLPDQPRILYNLALFENSQGNLAGAEKYLLEALKKDPDDFDFLYAICTFYIEHNKNSNAVDYARRMVDKYPQNPVGNQLLKAALQ